ncbi:MAG TPA: chemotaxis protein CheB [Patescibacteria group bacterium]|nr:chemotaxis protein CheB [Patescibacteria group bacterium]
MSRITITNTPMAITAQQRASRREMPPGELRHRVVPAKPNPGGMQVIGIGASAGGPAALAHILKYIPANFSIGIVVVQHIDAHFAPALVNWLGNQSALRVRLAEDGETPAAGTVLLAGQEQHLVMCADGSLRYTEQPVQCGYRPSVDVFFESLAEHWRGRVTGVILTGMGRDGARGLLRLRLAGHDTIAQDEASSGIYGMPKAAAELRAARKVLGLNRIGPYLGALGTMPA